MNVFDETKEVVFSTEEIKNEARAAEKIEEVKIEDEASDQMDISEAAIENEPEAAEVGLVNNVENGQKFVNASDAYGYFDQEADKGVIDQHEAYARQGRNQEYYRDPTYHKVRRNYEGRGRYPWGNSNGNYRPRYNNVYARDNSNPDSIDQAAPGYSEQTKYYTEDRRETGRDVVRQYNNDGIPVYTGRKSRQFETVGCVIRMLDLAGFKLGDRLVLIDKETGEVYR